MFETILNGKFISYLLISNFCRFI